MEPIELLIFIYIFEYVPSLLPLSHISYILMHNYIEDIGQFLCDNCPNTQYALVLSTNNSKYYKTPGSPSFVLTKGRGCGSVVEYVLCMQKDPGYSCMYVCR